MCNTDCEKFKSVTKLRFSNCLWMGRGKAACFSSPWNFQVGFKTRRGCAVPSGWLGWVSDSVNRAQGVCYLDSFEATSLIFCTFHFLCVLALHGNNMRVVRVWGLWSRLIHAMTCIEDCCHVRARSNHCGYTHTANFSPRKIISLTHSTDES